MQQIHGDLAQYGYARLGDLKSRVHLLANSLSGEDAGGEFVVIRLITTNPRPVEERHAMAQVIHDWVCNAIRELRPSFWWQCCVLIDTFERSDYLKTDSRS